MELRDDQAMELRCSLRPLIDCLQGNWFEWAAIDPQTGRAIPVERLGERLQEIAMSRGIRVVVATHSPAILSAADSVRRVSRSGDHLATAEIDRTFVDNLKELGLDPSDLMGWYRAYLLVEGEHDKIVLHGLLGEDLDRMRVKILTARGGSKMAPALESQLLLNNTGDAAIIAVLDKIDTPTCQEVWAAASQISDPNEAKKSIKSELEGKGVSEWSWAKDFMGEALSPGLQSRATLLGLPEADILRYIHPQFLCPDMPATWDEVATKYFRNSSSTNPDSSGWSPDKQWIETTFNFTIDQVLPAAVARMADIPNEVPDDLLALRDDVGSFMEGRAR